ncbi:uncharacterized protein LOC129220460 [Uloborus diversus]|uniref:uncharacterized protein LOC129220460 n=1 Tax=Uloborus diversus TaxID=327109 RepID=UPI0024094202|nr:uncharacterized protein LOC129220460 [Uloborus diversus]
MSSSKRFSPNGFHEANAVGLIDLEKEDREAANEIIMRKVQRNWQTSRITAELKKNYFLKTFGYDSDEDDDDFFPEDVIIPSRYTGSEFINFFYEGCSEDEENSSEVDEEVGGKWMLFLDRKEENEITGLTALDEAWQKIMLLGNFKNTGVIWAACSTACVGPPSRAPNENNGVICCFTPDYRNKAQVKNAAECIRRAVEYPQPLFYKTDKNTQLGKYRHLGHKYLSVYKHTPSNMLYERNEVDHLWYPVALHRQQRTRR